MTRLAHWLLYACTAGIVFGMSKLHAAVIAPVPYDYTGTSRFAWSLAYIFLLSVTAYAIGLPDLARGFRSALLMCTLAPVFAAMGISAVQLLVGDALLPRFVVLGSAILLVPAYLFCVALAKGGRQRAEDRDRVVLVAPVSEGDNLRDELRDNSEFPAVILKVMEVADATVQGTSRPLVEVVTEEQATVVVLDRDAQNDETIVAQAAELHEQGLRVRTLSLFYEQWIGKLPLSELERVSLMFDIGEIHRTRYGRIKRVADVLFGVVGLLALVVLTPFVLIGDLLGNRGSLFYRQARVGKNGQPFEILKFRTMRAPASTDEQPSTWTVENDPRITPFGKLLRSTHLDELPQAWNILRGDLSIVGPRPEQPHYVEELMEKVPFYSLRHLVRPGLTGWAQVKYHYGADEIDATEKLQYEFFYLRNQKVSLDLRIIGRTLRSVIGRGGR